MDTPLPLGAGPKPSYPTSELPGQTHNFDPSGAQPAANDNPYTGVLKQDQERMGSAGAALADPNISSRLNGFQDQIDALSKSYPSFENSLGLGSQSPYGQPASPEPSAASHGFNPWSLKGEALSR